MPKGRLQQVATGKTLPSMTAIALPPRCPSLHFTSASYHAAPPILYRRSQRYSILSKLSTCPKVASNKLRHGSDAFSSRDAAVATKPSYSPSQFSIIYRHTFQSGIICFLATTPCAWIALLGTPTRTGCRSQSGRARRSRASRCDHASRHGRDSGPTTIIRSSREPSQGARGRRQPTGRTRALLGCRAASRRHGGVEGYPDSGSTRADPRSHRTFLGPPPHPPAHAPPRPEGTQRPNAAKGGLDGTTPRLPRLSTARRHQRPDCRDDARDGARLP